VSQARPRLIVVSELYYPEETSTGYFVTRLAERATAEYEVHAISAQPTYAARGDRAPASEVRNGVRVERRSTTRFDKDVFPLRALNALTVSLFLALGTFERARKGDQVLVVTNPPLLPFTVWCAARLRGARVALLVHDVYPDVLVATGWIARGGFAARVLGRMTTWLYSRVNSLIVIGRDMADLISRRSPALAASIAVVTNWADTDDIRPLNRDGSQPDFVVLYSGNIGRTHALEALLDAAELLREDRRIRFVISGSGGKRGQVETRIRSRGLGNVSLQDAVPRMQLGTHLASASLCVVALVPGMYGVSVPSRMYNIMAAGRPLLAIADRNSEIWRVVREHDIGWTLDADSPATAIADAIRQAADSPEAVRAAGARAREAALAHYTEDKVAGEFLAALHAGAR
jgi:colanic acid biosynthesis glycosyl transferase WcaI